MTSRPRQALFVLGAKLIGLDCVLPLALQLKAEQPDLRIHFLFLAQEYRDIAEQNYVLASGMHAVGSVSVLSSRPGSKLSKAMAAVRLGRWMTWLRKAPSLLFAYHDLQRFPFGPLAKACRAGGGLAIVHGKAIYPFNDDLRADHIGNLKDRDVSFRDSGDRFVLWHPDQRVDYSPWTKAPATVLGTPRAYPAWHTHLQRITNSEGLLDDQGRKIGLNADQPTFVGFYIGWVVIPSLKTPPEDQFTTFFEQVRAVCPQANILLKPHPLCDLAKMRAALAPFGDLNIAITFAHPQLLARLATAAVVANGSSVIDDVYAEGKPLLDIGDYTDGLEEGLFANVGRTGATTPDAMAEVLRLAVTAPEQLARPDATHLVWEKPDSVIKTLLNGPTHSAPLGSSEQTLPKDPAA